MGLFRQNKEPKTAADYRQIAEEYAARAKAMRRTFLKTGIIVLSGLVTILAISVAWFASNTNVRSSGAHIQASDIQTFYLATKETDAQPGVYDDNRVYDDNTAKESALVQALKKFQRIDQVENGGIDVQSLPQFHVGTTKITGTDGSEYIVGDADGISLMVNTTSNVKNDSVDGHVGPGSRGEITFYLIPKVSGNNQQATITVSLAAYRLMGPEPSAENEQPGEESSNQQSTARAELIDGNEANNTLRNLLCGHILLFRKKDTNGDYKTQLKPVLGDDGSIQFSFTEKGDWVENQPIEITLYWIWPHRFENLVYASQAESVFQHQVDDQESPQSALISWINKNKDYIVTPVPESLKDAGTGMSNSALVQWSAGYNRGDQLIGDTVAYFVWTISAVK